MIIFVQACCTVCWVNVCNSICVVKFTVLHVRKAHINVCIPKLCSPNTYFHLHHHHIAIKCALYQHCLNHRVYAILNHRINSIRISYSALTNTFVLFPNKMHFALNTYKKESSKLYEHCIVIPASAYLPSLFLPVACIIHIHCINTCLTQSALYNKNNSQQNRKIFTSMHVPIQKMIAATTKIIIKETSFTR